MIRIQHRVNKISELAAVKADGVEIDLRSGPRGLHLAHDLGQPGDAFAEWLKFYKLKGPLILNTKEDGLEEEILKLLAQHGVENYFFLDTALPTLVRHVTAGNKNFAVRLSAFEPPEFVEKFVGLCAWVWVDCFNVRPMDPAVVAKVARDFKICLVSPELQKGPMEKIADFRKLFQPDAVCTKRPDLWA